jgi:hypothetical protein
VDGARRQQLRQRLAFDRLRPRRGGQAQQLGMLGGGLGGVQQAVQAPSRIAERGPDRMNAEQPIGGRARRGGTGERSRAGAERLSVARKLVLFK